MKSKLVKIAILFPLCFLNFLWGCYESAVVNESRFILNETFVNVEQKGSDWRIIRLRTNVEGLYDSTEKISCNRINNSGCLRAGVMVFRYRSVFTEKITDYDFYLLESKESLIPLIRTDLGQTFFEYMEMINAGFTYGDQNMMMKNPPGLGKDTISIPRVFYFKEEPTFLKDKDFQVVFSIKTEEGKTFADTTKVVRLNW